MINTMYNSIESLFAWINKSTKKSIYHYCDLESADDIHTLITKDGSLVSVMEYIGANHMISSEEYAYLCQQINLIFAPLLQKKGIQIKCFFRYDSEDTEEEIESLLQPSVKTAQRLDLKISDYFLEKKKNLTEVNVYEKCYIVVWTTPQIIDGADQKRIYKEKAKNFRGKSLKISNNAQHILHVINEVRLQHSATMTMLEQSFTSLGLCVERLEVGRLLNRVKKQLAPDAIDRHWQAHLPGDKIHAKPSYSDWSAWLWPSLSRQLFTEHAKNNNMSTCTIGQYRYAPVVISLFPKHIQSFYQLFKTLKEYKVPWQIAYSLSSDGVKISQSKALLAQFLTFSSHENRLICNAHKLLKHLDENSDTPITNFSVALMTWAPVEDEVLFNRRKTALTKAVQSWGGAQVTTNFGDAFQVVTNTTLAMNKGRFPCAVAAPLEDAVAMMPLFRPATSWRDGAMIFRTPDGKLWPYQSGSSQQVSWVELIYARSGAGKSVLLNALNFAACLKQGVDELPYISILDIGKSSEGIIDFIEQTSQKKGVAQSYTFEFQENDAINPFDTFLGARYPSSAHRDFLINLVSIFLIEDMDSKLPDGMDSMLGMVIDTLYVMTSDNQQPKRYHQGVNDEVDAVVYQHFSSQENITWWQVTDYLFEQGQVQLAEVAQRYAMPLLSDLIIAVNHSAILDLYQQITLSNGENFIQYFCRNITAIIKNFPSINMVTRLAVTARLVAFDLSSVMSGGSSKDVRTSVIAYMLVRHLTASYFFVKSHDLTDLPLVYQDHHKRLIKSLLMIPKRIVFDEFHRTHGCQPILRQVLTDMREGRKHNVQVTLASQSLSDFSPTMLEFATSIFILSGGNQSALDNTVKHFGLNETESTVLKQAVHGPGSNGMNFIAQFHTKQGVNTQLLNLTLCAYELWIFTTTAEDVYLKTLLCEHAGILDTLKILADYFATGSAKRFFEIELKRHPDKTIKQIAQELLTHFLHEYDLKRNNARSETQLNNKTAYRHQSPQLPSYVAKR
ncbi:hypothetical protein [Facilibium subflavum]|uniref:hypothetical protein n=1 Tax=Facilibium subflavum TaxID=2219058 RepID=UPI001AAD072B|nr:hypothetical protein [Facilibium subflavum]